MQKFNNITLGSDPEVFIVNKVGKIVPSCGLIGGTKEEPLMIGNDGYSVQEDNILLEGNIPPAKTVDEFIHNIEFLKSIMQGILNDKGLKVSIQASGFLTEEDLNDPQAVLFGCSEDYNAWTKDVNPKPKAENHLLRSAGGHVHVGYDNHTMEQSMELVKLFDLFLGVPSILMDSDCERRKLYGKAGAFRFTAFGFEYRTLSNFWLKNPTTIKWLYDNIIAATVFYNKRKQVQAKDFDFIQMCINNQDKKLALSLCKKYHINYLKQEQESLLEYFDKIDHSQPVQTS